MKCDISKGVRGKFYGGNGDFIGAKTQVKAQFGDDSNQKQAVGLKKKSEYKSPTKKKTTT